MAIKHINITLADKLSKEIDKIRIKQGISRSRFLSIAAILLIKRLKSRALREALKKGYQEMAEESLNITKEMEKLEEESLKHIGDQLIER
jgi:CopG family transcriptional regulator/antitoxin EndoAI